MISPRYRPPIFRAAIVVGVLLASRPLAASPGDTAFLAATQAAMTTMMDAMHVTSSGDADRDFVATMVPHHRGAIEMAEAELRYGRNPQLTRIAQEIIVTQQQEIAAMHLALGQPLARPAQAPDKLRR